MGGDLERYTTTCVCICVGLEIRMIFDPHQVGGWFDVIIEIELDPSCQAGVLRSSPTSVHVDDLAGMIQFISRGIRGTTTIRDTWVPLDYGFELKLYDCDVIPDHVGGGEARISVSLCLKHLFDVGRVFGGGSAIVYLDELCDFCRKLADVVESARPGRS